MKIQVIKQIEFEPVILEIKAKVRYWEDSTVNGEADTLGDKIPCREGSMWNPIIDLASGEILNWTKGNEANIHYKVCDNGEYFLFDDDENCVKYKDDYVPIFLGGYGDYIEFKVNSSGFIEGWNYHSFNAGDWELYIK